MKNKNLQILVILFIVLCGIQLLSGIGLFFYKIGFTYEMVGEYFLGNEDKFIMAKEFNGLLETSMFHFVGQLGVGFIVAHFILFIKEKSKLLIASGYLVLIFGLVDILSPYLIINFGAIFVWWKIIGFVGFEISMFYILINLLISFKNNKVR
ncbi:MAG: hypothetical protein OIF32_07625 [Campylobacterales bacterium]|nr:hypothetical protein [Campylobacterales bacterium]